MRKNLLSLFLGGAVSIAMLSACSGGEESSGTSNPDSGKTYEISYSTWANPGEPAYLGMEKFKEIVEEKTDGKITVELFPGNQLGSTEEQMEQVKLGTIQMMSSGNPGLDEIEYLSLPYLMKSNAHWMNVLESDIGQEWNEKLVSEMGIRNIGILPRGPRVISANKEIQTPDDMKGLKLRSPERDYYVQTFEALQANPTPMDFGEVYSGLQTGVVDGQENPLETFYASGFQEVQEYVILSNHMYKPAFVTINDQFFQDLSEEYQKVLVDAAEESEAYTDEKLEESEQTMRDEIEKAGVTFVEPDVDLFIESTQKVRDTLGVKTWGEEVYQQIVEMGQADL
ncbi:TRAP transporter substrate-binding protein [Bacillus sp. NTK034]|uniref:TRAP transporter substrate-binding protein n=1 Tax=Bacillus sp. NTK034 TaxID=2802176 RepID=UPI001A901384|nr:TRAP transporter substrate-binding protein [Bacillus sp. NTK034]MBN8201434.1 TRAP transporter substrate-binding protein [Bacillus sp. NTK034]